MKDKLDLLQEIQRVPAPDHLYASIQQRIAGTKTIPMRWLRVAAAAALLLILMDTFAIWQASTSQAPSSTEEAFTWVATPQNQLYDVAK